MHTDAQQRKGKVLQSATSLRNITVLFARVNGYAFFPVLLSSSLRSHIFFFETNWHKLRNQNFGQMSSKTIHGC